MRIKEIFAERERDKSEDSHELGVKIPPGVLDVLARLLELFFPTEEVLEETSESQSNSNLNVKEFSARVSRKFSIRRFELLNFDLRADSPEVLEAILQRSLVERYDHLMAKNAFYILNRIVSFSRETVANISQDDNNNVFLWVICQRILNIPKWFFFFFCYNF